MLIIYGYLFLYYFFLIILIKFSGKFVGFSDKVIKLFDKFIHQRREIQVLIAAAFSVIVIAPILIYMVFPILPEDLKEPRGIWNFIILLISAPIAFVIWRFRDENQRKDINLKEFQKIAEWVSGMHLQEDKIIEKKITKTDYGNNTETVNYAENETIKTSEIEISENSEISKEVIRETFSASDKQAISTFSKSDGAVGLQIAAIYNLLPFYRGDYGKDFEKPAVNLLKSAWLVLQQGLLSQFYECRKEEVKIIKQCLQLGYFYKLDKKRSNIHKQIKEIFEKLMRQARSPLGEAITRVWLACDDKGRLLIHRHPEIFPNLCLSGMDFSLAGLNHEVLAKTLFIGHGKEKLDCSGIQLQSCVFLAFGKLKFNFSNTKLIEADLCGANLRYADFRGADLRGADFRGADLRSANLNIANLRYADLIGADLIGANLNIADFMRADLRGADLRRANFRGANLRGAYLIGADLRRAYLIGADLRRADLRRADLIGARNIEYKQLIESQNLFGVLIDNKWFEELTYEQKAELKSRNVIVIVFDDNSLSLESDLSVGILEYYLEGNHENKYEYRYKIIRRMIDIEKTCAENPNWVFELKEKDNKQNTNLFFRYLKLLKIKKWL